MAVEAALTGRGNVKALQLVLSTHRQNFLRCQRTDILRQDGPHVLAARVRHEPRWRACVKLAPLHAPRATRLNCR